jgi:hypothetical protein
MMYEVAGAESRPRFTACGMANARAYTAGARARTSSSGGGIRCFRPPAGLESGEYSVCCTCRTGEHAKKINKSKNGQTDHICWPVHLLARLPS